MASQAQEFEVQPPETFDAPPLKQSQALVPRNPFELLAQAVKGGAPIETVERLAAMEENYFKRNAEIHFNEAMNAVQAELMERIVPDLANPQTKSKYASYAALDRKIRPVYTKHGFSLSFDTADCPKAEHVRLLCYVANGGHTRRYQMDIPADGKGAKGGDVMTKTHATGAANSYGRRYLVLDIFNLAVGEPDDDGNASGMDKLEEHLDWIGQAKDVTELQRLFKNAIKLAEDANDEVAKLALSQKKNQRWRELNPDAGKGSR
jgi:hypothetical protein